jgi:hypothetical protein
MPPRVLFPGLAHWKSFSTGYRLDLAEPAGASTHAFCGAHDIRGAWCFSGDHPLLRFVSFDTRDDRLGFNELGVPFVHLLYCWRCDVGDLEYRLERDGGVTALGEREWIEGLKRAGYEPEEVRERLRKPETDFPYQDYPWAFPLQSVELRQISGGEQNAILASELDGAVALPAALGLPCHQVGGLPYLTQGSSCVPSCPECSEPMAFVASIADDCGDPRGFTSNEFVQVVFFLCPRCRRMKAGNMCD